jgi:hypothetical protein
MAPQTDAATTARLQRAGQVLLAAGAADLALLAGSALAGLFYPSSLNVLALAAGVYLKRGSMRAAAVVRWMAWFTLAAVPLLAAALLLVLPPAFWWVLSRSHPTECAVVAAALLLPVALAAWLLGALPAPGRARRAWMAPVASAAGVAVASGALVAVMQSTAVSQAAVDLARRQVGPGFGYVVVSLRLGLEGGAPVFRGGVLAWNRNEAKYVPYELRP